MTMTDAPPAAAVAPEAGKKGKKGKKKKEGGRSNLLPAIVLAGGIAAGGYFMGGSSEAAAPVPTTEVEVAAGPLLALDPMTVNLAGGSYLRVGVSFQMTDAYEGAVEVDEGHAFAGTDASRVQDLLIARLGGRSPSELQTPEGRADVKQELLVEAAALLDGEVMDIYLTQFVIQ